MRPGRPRRQVHQLITAGGHQPAGFAHRAQMVLFEQCCRLLQTVLEHLGGFKGAVAAAPLVLPMKGQSAQAQHGYAQTHQGAIGEAMQSGQPWGLTHHLAS